MLGQFINKVKETLGQNVVYQYNWFKAKIQILLSKGQYKKDTLLGDSTRQANLASFGDMYFFMYDPKHKLTLPYYDTFPLVFPFEYAKGGFYGLNLHYIPPKERFILLGKLLEFSNTPKFTAQTKLRLSYNLLRSATFNPYMKPCIKHYLLGHVRSKFIKIQGDEWHIAATLPHESFVKLDKNSIWNKL